MTRSWRCPLSTKVRPPLSSVGTLSPITCIRQGTGDLKAEPQGCMAWLYSVATNKDWLMCHPRLGWGPRRAWMRDCLGARRIGPESYIFPQPHMPLGGLQPTTSPGRCLPPSSSAEQASLGSPLWPVLEVAVGSSSIGPAPLGSQTVALPRAAARGTKARGTCVASPYLLPPRAVPAPKPLEQSSCCTSGGPEAPVERSALVCLTHVPVFSL